MPFVQFRLAWSIQSILILLEFVSPTFRVESTGAPRCGERRHSLLCCSTRIRVPVERTRSGDALRGRRSGSRSRRCRRDCARFRYRWLVLVVCSPFEGVGEVVRNARAEYSVRCDASDRRLCGREELPLVI